MGDVTDPMAAFGVGNTVFATPQAHIEQRLDAARLGDHHGRVGLAALGVLVDEVCGIPFAVAPPTGPTVQARLGISVVGELVTGDLLTATSTLLNSDDFGIEAGLEVVEVTSAGGGVVALGSARSVRVGRHAQATPESGYGAKPVPAAGQSPTPDPIDPGLSGRQIVAGLASGAIDRGPLADLLSADITPEDGELAAVAGLHIAITTSAWMGNYMGTMHGGVIATILGHALSIGAQTGTAPGQLHRLVDMTANFFRSPPVDGEVLDVIVEPDRVGRRIGTYTASMTGPDGKLLARATGDAHFG
ncbi:hypothetical protein GCM10027169_18230 [Gordonia jinhuaensis]|uniref:Thioesterase domain-containing protein n=2 Tax=Gordonia jinhuaensis TaxID=1517702 RepID=A0A916TIJ1_9ACTN|nr:hypothetical protein GCM10011489_37550 [Gordonia jinhuaensis]